MGIWECKCDKPSSQPWDIHPLCIAWIDSPQAPMKSMGHVLTHGMNMGFLLNTMHQCSTTEAQRRRMRTAQRWKSLDAEPNVRRLQSGCINGTNISTNPRLSTVRRSRVRQSVAKTHTAPEALSFVTVQSFVSAEIRVIDFVPLARLVIRVRVAVWWTKKPMPHTTNGKLTQRIIRDYVYCATARVLCSRILWTRTLLSD